MIILLMFSALSLFLYCENNALSTTHYEVEFDNLPRAFEGYRIVQLSDLHNKSFGKKQQRLIAEIQKAEPNVIVITGDLVDRRNYQEDISMDLVKEAVKIAPVYYVTGNHEWWSGRYSGLRQKLLEAGVVVLESRRETLQRGRGKITIMGVDDPAKLVGRYKEKTEREAVKDILEAGFKGMDEEDFKILLAHRPEKIELYMSTRADLVLSGHVHGGQWRIPWLGGLIAPGQGFFPKYDGGKYQVGKTTLIVSRGLGNSLMPIRLFNRPEVILVTLTGKR